MAALVCDGLQNSGAMTWVFATVIVWAVALVARLLLPLVNFKQVLARSDMPPGWPDEQGDTGDAERLGAGAPGLRRAIRVRTARDRQTVADGQSVRRRG